jgi:release factor glutamine methyltransferase
VPGTQDSALGTQPSALPKEWTVGGLLDWTARFLAGKGSEFPRLDAEVLLAHTLGCRRIELYTRYDEAADADARERFRALVKRRVEGCPVAYLVGRKEFFGLEFEVGPAVLIPRPDTELVVVEALRLAKGMAEPRVLDIGTGSGAIAVAVAHRHKGAKVTAVDLSPDALAVAERNAARHGVSGRVRCLRGDLFAPLPAGERFDLILSNPPYIAREDIPGLPVGVRHYEPSLALDGGPGGFEVFERLVAEAPDFLEAGGHLVVEIGSPQEGPARERIGGRKGFALAATVHDYSGHPRVLRARWDGPSGG